MRGQTTIEFILVLVIVLVILATISMPTVDRIEQDVTDVGTAASLAAVQQRLVNSAEELSLSGCGSHKNVTVFVDADAFNKAKVSWNTTHVYGSFLMVNGTQKYLKDLPYPNYVSLTNYSLGGGYWIVAVKKDCTGTPPSGCIGDGC